VTPQKGPQKAQAPPIDVRLDADRLQATVQVALGAKVSADDVARELQRAGVVHGLVADGVRLALARRGTRVVVARGTPPVTGAAGRIECESLDTRESATFTPLEDDHGTVDSHGGHLMQTVEPGQVLAHIIDPEPGAPGQKVTGDVIAAVRGKDATPVLGPGTRLSDDRKQILATRGGLPSVQDGRFSVLVRCEVKNVDFTSGDVHFAGSVIVSGDVQPGFTVVATEDIEVRGGVEHATLRAGGKITVVGGITHAAVLEAIGDVAVRFVDSGCKVTSGGTISVRENALRSTLVARRVVVGHQLVAGRTTASELISAALIGNESEAHTELQIARPPRPSWQQAAELVKQHAKEKAEIQSLRLALQLAGHDAARLKRLVPQEVQHELKLRAVDHQAAMAKVEIAPESCAIAAQSKMFRGVTATIHEQLHVVAETVGKRTLRLVDGQVAEE
jgi:uncharacterized protein (DUF342 family)